jgi:hypothetical protein
VAIKYLWSTPMTFQCGLSLRKEGVLYLEVTWPISRIRKLYSLLSPPHTTRIGWGELRKPGYLIQAAMLFNRVSWVHWTLTSWTRGAGSLVRLVNRL